MYVTPITLMYSPENPHSSAGSPIKGGTPVDLVITPERTFLIFFVQYFEAWKKHKRIIKKSDDLMAENRCYLRVFEYDSVKDTFDVCPPGFS